MDKLDRAARVNLAYYSTAAALLVVALLALAVGYADVCIALSIAAALWLIVGGFVIFALFEPALRRWINED